MSGFEPWKLDAEKIWGITLLVCCGITAFFGVSIVSSQSATQRSVNRLILNRSFSGPSPNMHQLTFTDPFGVSSTVDVSGTITPADVVLLIEALDGKDEVPVGWKSTKWKIASGSKIEIRTPPLPGEVAGGVAHCDRHKAFVDTIQISFPPV